MAKSHSLWLPVALRSKLSLPVTPETRAVQIWAEQVCEGCCCDSNSAPCPSCHPSAANAPLQRCATSLGEWPCHRADSSTSLSATLLVYKISFCNPEPLRVCQRLSGQEQITIVSEMWHCDFYFVQLSVSKSTSVCSGWKSALFQSETCSWHFPSLWIRNIETLWQQIVAFLWHHLNL